MAKKFAPVALTANDLLEGDVIWWTGSGWTRDLAGAVVAEDPEAASTLLALGASEAGSVVGAYLVELNQARRPLQRREAIRADREPTFAFGAAALPLRKAA